MYPPRMLTEAAMMSGGQKIIDSKFIKAKKQDMFAKCCATSIVN